MTPAEISIAIAGLAFAGLVKGATGIGYSTSALPIIALAIGLERAMPLVLLPSLSSNLSVMFSAGEFGSTLHRFRWLYVALLPGLVCGLSALAWISADNAAHVLGAIIVGYVVYTTWKPTLVIPKAVEPYLNFPVGFANGFINGLTGSQLLPIVPYGLSLDLSPNTFIQFANIGFTLSSLIMLVGLQRIGFLDTHTFVVSLAGVVPGLAGVALGTRIRRAISPDVFRRRALAVLAAMGVLLMLARPSHDGMAGTEVKMMTGQESRVVRCGTSGKRHDTDCHHLHPALRVALARPTAASGGSTVDHRYAFRRPPCGSISRQHDDGRALVRKAG